MALFSLSELLLAEHMPAWVKKAYWAFKYTVKRMLASYKDQHAFSDPIRMVHSNLEPSDQGRSTVQFSYENDSSLGTGRGRCLERPVSIYSVLEVVPAFKGLSTCSKIAALLSGGLRSFGMHE